MHDVTHDALPLCAAALAVALAAPHARADIFSWTDATGRLNISNVEPPDDVHARRIVQQPAPPAPTPAAGAEVAALKERVAELESEVDRAREAAPPPAPVVVVPPVVVAPPPEPAPAPEIAPPLAYAPSPDAWPCDPLTFGCPAFGLPVNVFVVSVPGFHRFHGAYGPYRKYGAHPGYAGYGAYGAHGGYAAHGTYGGHVGYRAQGEHHPGVVPARPGAGPHRR